MVSSMGTDPQEYVICAYLWNWSTIVFYIVLNLYLLRWSFLATKLQNEDELGKFPALS